MCGEVCVQDYGDGWLRGEGGWEGLGEHIRSEAMRCHYKSVE